MEWHSENYLTELLQPTPYSVEKLLAAWCGLSLKEKVYLIEKLENNPSRYLKEIIQRIIHDSNSFIRYKVAKLFFEKEHLYRNFEMFKNEKGELCCQDNSTKENLSFLNKVKNLIENDKSNLVRGCLTEEKYHSLSAPDVITNRDKFFALDQKKRLSILRVQDMSHIKAITTLFKNYKEIIDKKFATKEEIIDLLTDLVCNSYFRKLEYSKNIYPLWGLVHDLPDEVSYPLLEHLPLPEVSYFWGLFTEKDSHIIRALLSFRHSKKINQFRKDLLVNPASREEYELCLSSPELYYTDEEFEKIIPSIKNVKLNYETQDEKYKEELNKIEIFQFLNGSLNGIKLVHEKIIYDVLLEIEQGLPKIKESIDIDSTDKRFDFKLDKYIRRTAPHHDWEIYSVTYEERLEIEILEVRLYRLAEKIISWSGEINQYLFEKFNESLKKTSSQFLQFNSCENAWELYLIYKERFSALGDKTKKKVLSILPEIQ